MEHRILIRDPPKNASKSIYSVYNKSDKNGKNGILNILYFFDMSSGRNYLYHAIAMTISGASPIGYAGLLVLIPYDICKV